MEKRRDYKNLIIFILIVLLVGILVILNISNIEEYLGEAVKTYGLIAVLILSIISDLFMQPIGPEIPATIGIASGLKIINVYFATAIGSALGSIISFFVGKYFLLEKIGSICHVKKYNNYCKTFYKYGKYGLFISSISPIPFTLFCWLSGAFHMKLRDFIIFGVVPRMIRITFYIGLIWIIFG